MMKECCGVVFEMQTHILPREICGKSTFLVAMMLMKSLPVWLTDTLLVAYTYLTLGDTASVGIPRPTVGPMLMKEKSGKTPILDVGTFAAIKSGQVKVTTLTAPPPTNPNNQNIKTETHFFPNHLPPFLSLPVQVRPAVECLTPTGAQFEDGSREDFDAVILATGYRSNVPKWLKVSNQLTHQSSN